MRVAALLQHVAGPVDLGAAEIGGNVEGVGQPFHGDAGLPFEFVGEILRQVGVGTFVVAVDLEPARHLANPSDAPVFAGEMKQSSKLR